MRLETSGLSRPCGRASNNSSVYPAEGWPAVVAVTRSDLPGEGLERLARHARLAIWGSPAGPTPGELASLCANASGLICLPTDRIDGQLLAACPALRVISTVGVGYDHFDLAALRHHGVVAGNTPGVLAETTADLAFALILATGRRLKEGMQLAHCGEWQPGDIRLLLGHDIHGATLGLVGFGEIGRAVARRAHGFGMRVVHHTRSRTSEELSEPTSLENLLEVADFVSLHVPLTRETHHLIGRPELELMKPTASLVNTARGGVVDQQALIEMLQRGRIFAAGLDVTAVEPTPAGDTLLGLPNCIVLPHIGSASLRTRAAMVSRGVDNVIAGIAGHPLPHPVPGSIMNTETAQG